MRDANRIIRPVELVQANISHSRKIFDRLVEVAESRGESLATVSKALGLHLSSFYRWKKGSMPQDRTVRLVADHLRVREEWLRDGTEPRDAIVGDRLSPIGLVEPEKEDAVGKRLEGSSTVFRPRPSLPTTSTVKPPAINAAAARLSDEELEEVLSTSIQRLREEPEPLLKLGYLATLKACVDDMERRLSGESQ